VIKVNFPVIAGSSAKVWFNAEPKNQDYEIASIEFALPVGLNGAFVFDQPLNAIDLGFVLKPDQDEQRIKTWAEIIDTADEPGKRRGAAALESLQAQLRSIKIKHDGSTQAGLTADFLGITGIADAGGEFTVEVDPPGLLLSDGNDRPIFRARAEAWFHGGFQSPFAMNIDAMITIEVVLKREDILNLVPRIEVPDAPHLNLTFPEFHLPKWSLDQLSIPVTSLVFLQFPLRSFASVTTTWTPNPHVALTVTDRRLNLQTSPSKVALLMSNISVLAADDMMLTVNGNQVDLTASNITTGTATVTIPKVDLAERLPGPFAVTFETVKLTATAVGAVTGPLALDVVIDIGRATIAARNDPTLTVALSVSLTLRYDGTTVRPDLTAVKILDPVPINLALAAAQLIARSAGKLISLIHAIDVPDANAPGTPDLPSLESFLALLRRVGDMAVAGAAWMARQGTAAASALAGLAEAAFKLVAGLVTDLAETIAKLRQAVVSRIVVEIRLDAASWKIVQIVVTPLQPSGTAAFSRTFLGLRLDVPYAFSPALICDLEQEWVALVLQPSATAGATLSLSTDLWLSHDESKVTEPVSGAAAPTTPAQEPLLQLTVEPNGNFGLAVVAVERGKATFLKKIVAEPTHPPVPDPGGTIVAADHLIVSNYVQRLDTFEAGDFDITPHIDEGRILSLFRSAAPEAAPGGSDFGRQFAQSITVRRVICDKPQPPSISLSMDVDIKISDTTLTTTIKLTLDLTDLSVKVSGGRFGIDPGTDSFDLFGLKGKFIRKTHNPPLFMDFSSGDPKLGLSEQDAGIALNYDQISSDGRGLIFNVDRFIVSREGIDLVAAVDTTSPATLAGIDMPFRFDQGSLVISRNRIQSFGIGGHGNLPPALVGEAKASILLNFARNTDGKLGLQAATAVLDKSADPLRCEGTQFTITVTKLGLKFVEQGGYHFYFTLTGSAEFRPSTGAFSQGLLKNLSALRIVLDEAPLASDPRVLMKHIEFQVTVEPPKRTNFFDVFSFELRGVGFHPASDAFGGSPAFSISGQVNLTGFGDVPGFVHKLWIAPPEKGKTLPRIRFDGLGVGLALGAMGEASGTAYAVDDSLPTLFEPGVLPHDVTAKGFLAQGSLRIQGWASMSASMGFLEVDKAGADEKRQAFFLYTQRNDMSEKIPTPIGTIFLREVGFGFGYRYTLAGLAAADQAETPRDLVALLDQVSKYQGSLQDVRAWRPTYDNAALTLALRGLFSLTSVSTSEKYNEQGEKALANLVLFDIVAALRTDLTFLMNVRAWIAFNYADWRDAMRNRAAWTTNPALRGYMYLSAPRREFLARAVYNPGAEIGNHPKLPEPLKQAMQRVRWSSTLYIRPGLFHMEFGWPYELGFSLGKPSGNFYLNVEGGTVLRYEDAAILYGLAFRARGFIGFAYSTGGNIGASVSARADIAVGAKLIAYLAEHVGDSMFYGNIVLDITIVFSVRMWLKSRWFSASASFSASLTVHVAVELLVQPGDLAAHVEASISVSAFGRSLSLGVGFNLGPQDRLVEARARVQRFLSLGLGATYPNPEAGVPAPLPAPLPEPSRMENAKKSDERIENTVGLREQIAPDRTAPADPTTIPGVNFGPVQYWALLFPVKSDGTEQHYLVQLLPRGNEHLQCDTDQSRTRSHFFAAPTSAADNRDNPAYVVSGLQAGEFLKPPVGTNTAGAHLVATDWTADFGLDGSGDNAQSRPTLRQVFTDSCFMAGDEAQHYELTDVESIDWEPEPRPLPENPEVVSIALAKAARSRAECGPRRKRMTQVEEARSCFIATLADCAERLASLVSVTGSGESRKVTVDPRAGALEVDPSAIGLTFVLGASRLNDLFFKGDPPSAAPMVSGAFTVKTRSPSVPARREDPRPVMLFNPPERMFHQAPPVIQQARLVLRPSGVLISWRLGASWAGSVRGCYADPEFHLKHYRIERRIENLVLTDPHMTAPAPRQFQAKRAEHVEIVWDGEKLHKRRLYSDLHLVDDLQDLPPELRAALLPGALGADARSKKDGRSDGATPENVRVVYSVQPIDVAGTAGRTETLPPLIISTPQPQQETVLKAIARFNYIGLPKLGDPFAPAPLDFLELTIEESEQSPPEKPEEEDKAPVLKVPVDLMLRIRTERTVAAGVFGADALSQARSEPPVPARDEDPGAHDLDVRLVAIKAKDDTDRADAGSIIVTRVPVRSKARTTPGKIPDPKTKAWIYTIARADWTDALKTLDIGKSARQRAARLYLRRAPVGEVNNLYPDWVPVQLQLRVSMSRR
jgi:hypothetical protein